MDAGKRADMTECPRCGADHELKLEYLVGDRDNWQYWGMCPVVGQPVLIETNDRGDPEDTE